VRERVDVLPISFDDVGLINARFLCVGVRMIADNLHIRSICDCMRIIGAKHKLATRSDIRLLGNTKLMLVSLDGLIDQKLFELPGQNELGDAGIGNLIRDMHRHLGGIEMPVGIADGVAKSFVASESSRRPVKDLVVRRD
jgi:hypothetical protein